jgi:hypothetical protein
MIQFNCWVFGDDPNSIFPVQIEESKNIGNLKDSIKAKKTHTFQDIAARHLGLRMVSVVKNEVDAKLKQIDLDYLKTIPKLQPLEELSYIFSNPPVEGYVQIVVVQCPSGSYASISMPPPLDHIFQHSTPLPSEDFDANLNSFLEQCRPTMRRLVMNAKHVPSLIPSWNPAPSADKGLAEHISKLCTPTGEDSRPSLLLHDLGEEKSALDKERVARIPHIFSFGSHMCVTYLSVIIPPMPFQGTHQHLRIWKN